MLEIAREKLSGSAVTKFVKQDMLSFLRDQRDNSFDLITAFWAIGYAEPANVLKEIGRVLSNGGQAAIIVNIQESLSELQNIVTKIILRKPFVLKYIPPIHFPSGIKAFRKMSEKTGLIIDSLLEDSCVQAFDSGTSLVSWMKTAGPCAGFREALKAKYYAYVFDKIQNAVDQNDGIKLTFRFIRYVGTKQ
jgi:ubiquinone/menaquinone biosynthesis C-methylase UbiE